MAVSMESDIETIETFLQSLGLEKLVTSFHKNDIDLKLLLDLPEPDLKAMLIDMNLPIGSRYKIMQGIRKLIANDLSSNAIQLVTNGKEVGIQIGKHNICHLNIDISNELQTEEESGSTHDGDLVQMTLRMHTALSSGICIAFLEEKMLQALSGDQREEINKVLREKFGVEIIVCKKGSIVLVLRKIKPISKGLMYKKTQLDFLLTLFEHLGFSNKHPSEINFQVQLKSGDNIFNESQLEEKGLHLILSPRKTIACMAKEDQKKLVSCLFLKTIGSNLGDNTTSELQIETNFGIKIPNHTEDTKGDTEPKGLFERHLSDTFSKDCSVACNLDEIRIVLIGKMGAGKTATGNTILQNNTFKLFCSSISVTTFIAQNFVVRFGKKIVCVDTPGIFDTEVSNEKTQKEIMKCIGITSPGPHAFIIVLTLGRFTKAEQDTVDHFVKHFGEDVYQYFIVLFTRKDDLDELNISLKDHLAKVPEPLRLFIEKCGGRAIAFNNNLTGSESEPQVKELMKMIEQNVSRNEGKFYTNEMYLQAEIEVQKMELELIKKHRDEKDMKLKAWKESKEKSIEQMNAIISELKEKENRVRDDVRQDIAKNGFERAWKYVKSWWPF